MDCNAKIMPPRSEHLERFIMMAQESLRRAREFQARGEVIIEKARAVSRAIEERVRRALTMADAPAARKD